MYFFGILFFDLEVSSGDIGLLEMVISTESLSGCFETLLAAGLVPLEEADTTLPNALSFLVVPVTL